MSEAGDSPRPLDRLRVLAIQEVAIDAALRHVEIYTQGGLLSFFWHGAAAAENVLLACGGAMGGVLGPARGLYHDLGRSLAARGIGTIRVGYRQPNRLEACALDLGAAADVANRAGAKRFVVMGHSFGGAAAVSAAVALRRVVRGVVTLATQSAGCETAAALGDIPLLLLHGDRDELLPVEASHAVRTLAGHGEVVVLPGTGHLLLGVEEELRRRLLEWIPARFAET
jgi:pimeloyl-ACP methyl ester carboxylesterase